MNLLVPGINGYFDSTVLLESQVYTMGGANMSIQVTKNIETDNGSVTLMATNHLSDPNGWVSIVTVSVGDAPAIVATKFAYFKLIYSGTAQLSCCYSD